MGKLIGALSDPAAVRTDDDSWTVAFRMLHEHEEDAAAVVAGRIADEERAGDLEGVVRWFDVLGRLAELARAEDRARPAPN